MRFLAGVLFALVLAGAAQAQPASSGPVNTGHLTAELVSSAQGIAPGQTIHVALRQQIQKGWHTYWRNPGDAGERDALAQLGVRLVEKHMVYENDPQRHVPELTAKALLELVPGSSVTL